MSEARLTERVEAWRLGGELVEVGADRLFVRELAGEGPPLLFLHGFPSSSYDWREIGMLLSGRRITTFDFLGFGLSDKPRSARYSLFDHADAVSAVAGSLGGDPVMLVAHDMATSVATELLARELEGRLPFTLGGLLLLNGSMVIEAASLTAGQKLLRSPLGPLFARLTNERSFRRQFARIFSAEHPLSDAEAEDQWSLLAYHGGHRILDRLCFYLHERVVHGPRWHGALRDWPGRLELAWAGQDPVCTEAVLQAVLALRPDAPLTRLSALGHYPQLEDPVAVARIVARFADGGSAGGLR